MKILPLPDRQDHFLLVKWARWGWLPWRRKRVISVVHWNGMSSYSYREIRYVDPNDFSEKGPCASDWITWRTVRFAKKYNLLRKRLAQKAWWVNEESVRATLPEARLLR